MNGIVSYGVHLPYWRLDRSAITASLGQGGGRGTRSVASYDEDTTSMGVEAARRALSAAPDGVAPDVVAFATTAPAYADKTNATAIHAALRLPDDVPAFDVVGAARSGIAASRLARESSGLSVLSDLRTGRPGSTEEAQGGDAAVALLFAPDDAAPPIAVQLASTSTTAEFVDRWRVPGESYSRQWEERFGEAAYVPVAQHTIERLLAEAELTIDAVTHVVVTGLHARAVRGTLAAIGAPTDSVVDDRSATIGNTGTAHWALLLADVLDRAAPGDRVLVAQLADGCDGVILEVTDEVEAFRSRRPEGASVADQLARTRDDLDHATFMTWRGFLQREPPRRPEPDRPAAPPSRRGNDWKFGFVGARDEGGFVHLPPGRVSVDSGAIDAMQPEPMADRRATIATFTVDRLAFSLAPPVVSAIVDFDTEPGTKAARMQIELTDVDPETVRIGGRVEMTFRRLYTVDGIHNYFWKARPIDDGDSD